MWHHTNIVNQRACIGSFFIHLHGYGDFGLICWGMIRDMLDFYAGTLSRQHTTKTRVWSYSNFSAKILCNIGQKPYFDTRLKHKIVQTCSTGRVVNFINKLSTCANVKCCQARHDRFAFRRTQPRVKVGILYNFSQKIAGKIFERCPTLQA